MGDLSEGPVEWPDDDTDWARIYSLAPNLFSDFLAEFEALINSGRAQPADYVRFTERCLEVVRCLSDTHEKLPVLGLDLARFVELREGALQAEQAAFERYVGLGEKDTKFSWEYRQRQEPAPGNGPLSNELEDLILNLGLRGLDDERVACALDVHPKWPDVVRRRRRLHAGARDVVVSHLAGRTLAQVAKETGVPASTALRIIKLIGDRPNAVTSRVDARDRARTILKLREKGVSYKEIAQRLDCSMDTVKNVLRKNRQERYRRSGPAN